MVTESTDVPVVKTDLSQPLGYGIAGAEVREVQQRLTDLGFDPGPIDGQFGDLTRQAVWAFEKLVLQTRRATSATGVVTNEMWQRMQDPIAIEPLRHYSEGQATENHTEVYLPQQVVAFFVDDQPVLISHMSSGTGDEWREVVTIDPGECGNEHGTEPIKRGEMRRVGHPRRRLPATTASSRAPARAPSAACGTRSTSTTGSPSTGPSTCHLTRRRTAASGCR